MNHKFVIPSSRLNYKRKRRLSLSLEGYEDFHQSTSRDASDEDNTDDSSISIGFGIITSTVGSANKISVFPSKKICYHSNNSPHINAQHTIRVYLDGLFDIFHIGHARILESAKKLFPNVYLLVGVYNDEEADRHGGKTVMPGKDRCEAVRHCKWVDEVIPDAPWYIEQSFLDKYSIDYVAHDSKSDEDIYQCVKSLGKLLTIERPDSATTSEFIIRIIENYDRISSENNREEHLNRL
ncbi:hypothetical protein BDB01DRAFT_783102 [Pilobolus umbonatus]|nr:hypothetical protein BDB01DRAFT_783102 [Pilobolus umbonatus]